MSRAWECEKLFLEQLVKDLEGREPLPLATPEELEAHARQIAHAQDLLGLIAALPAPQRPPVAEWDDLLGPLWRRLFAKGDDIDRYILADLWRRPLLEAGETLRFVRSCAAVAASARNLYRFQEALDVCGEARRVSRNAASGALANLINTEGSVFLCQGDNESAESSFREAMAMAEALPEEEIREWVGAVKADFLCQEWINVADTYLRRGYAAEGEEKARACSRAREALGALEKAPVSPGFRRMVETNTAELRILEGRLDVARNMLQEELLGPGLEGPYRYSLTALHGRLLSVICSLEGDWRGAYHWIRLSLKEGINHAYPAEDHFIIEQAVDVLRGLHAARDVHSGESLVQDLAKLLEDKDWYTGRSHSRNVSLLAVRLGEEINEKLGAGLDLEELRTAGLLHDIGKLRIGWSLLNKIAPITPKELSILRDHSAYGGQILRQMGLDRVATLVEQHHETMNGTGYPSGRPPSLAAAIVGVGDVYEASISTNRRYKNPKSHVTALAELVTDSGRRYHADVVEALVQVVQSESAPFE